MTFSSDTLVFLTSNRNCKRSWQNNCHRYGQHPLGDNRTTADSNRDFSLSRRLISRVPLAAAMGPITTTNG